MSRKEQREDNQHDGKLSETELEQAVGGRRKPESESPKTAKSRQSAKNRACFRMLEEDFLFKRLERRGWRR